MEITEALKTKSNNTIKSRILFQIMETKVQRIKQPCLGLQMVCDHVT